MLCNERQAVKGYFTTFQFFFAACIRTGRNPSSLLALSSLVMRCQLWWTSRNHSRSPRVGQQDLPGLCTRQRTGLHCQPVTIMLHIFNTLQILSDPCWTWETEDWPLCISHEPVLQAGSHTVMHVDTAAYANIIPTGVNPDLKESLT